MAGSVQSPFYDERFYRMQKDGSYQSAEQVVPIVLKYIQPKTVIDIGCGVGPWLSVFQKHGAKVLGVDGAYVNPDMLYIDKANFQPVNLEQRFVHAGEKFDLAMTLEVAEHLTPARADTFVEDLTKLSDVVLFSAAIIAQGGVNHINEQMPSYWAEKFLKNNFVCVDCIRPAIWNNDKIASFYRQNIFLYVNVEALKNYPKLHIFYLEHKDSMILDVVHPLFWIGAQQRFQNLIKAILPPPRQVRRLNKFFQGVRKCRSGDLMSCRPKYLMCC